MFQVLDYQTGDVKLTGRSRGLVLDNRDPLQRGRIRIDHPLLGETVWVNYLRTPSSFNIPSIGDVVYVECDVGEGTHPVAWGNIVTGNDTDIEIPDTFKRDIPTNRGFFTPGGHLIEFDDGVANLNKELDDTDFTTENRGIRFTSTAGNIFHINEDEDGSNQSIIIQDVSGNIIKLDYSENKLTIDSKGAMDILAAEDKTETIGGNETKSVQGNADNTVAGNLSITVTGNATVEADGNVVLKGTGQTEVGDSSSPTNVQGNTVQLAGGGPGVARIGDRAIGVGNLGAPVTSTIIAGSSKTLSG